VTRECVVIGIDCATDAAKTGACRGVVRGERCVLFEARFGASFDALAAQIARWLGDAPRALLALDAPLGWPAPLADNLVLHRAGERLVGDPNSLFRRVTDRRVKHEFHLTPLDVGADRIARTAHAALELLARVRAELGAEIPLAWDPGFEEGVRAIEVYPAATLRAHGLPWRKYKRPDDLPVRVEIVRGLCERIDAASLGPLLEREPDLLDAAVCVLAGLDFLTGRALAPEARDVAQKEGWIWVRRPP
jgi:predicted RNase H-like nuclease